MKTYSQSCEELLRELRKGKVYFVYFSFKALHLQQLIDRPFSGSLYSDPACTTPEPRN